MHFNNKAVRDALEKQIELETGVNPFKASPRRFCTYVNLCLHPYTWEQTYYHLRQRKTISLTTWSCLSGAVLALFINLNRKTGETTQTVAEVVPDFVEYIRSDKTNDPWKFLLSMRRYLPRFITVKALARVGLDWRKLSVELMGAYKTPKPATYHTLFTNIYVRSLVKAMVVFRLYRTTGDADYQPGVNDIITLVEKEAKSKKCISAAHLLNLVERLQETLPSWSVSARARACYYCSYLMPLHYLYEKQMLPSLERNVLGTTTKET